MVINTQKRYFSIFLNYPLIILTGWTVPGAGSRVVAEQSKVGGVQRRPGGVAVRRGGRETRQVPHQTSRARSK